VTDVTKRKPVEVYKFGHLHVVLHNSEQKGRTYGIYANYDRDGLRRNKPIFSGIIESTTGTELRRIAGAVDMIYAEGRSS
jgi:hypothetical protein